MQDERSTCVGTTCRLGQSKLGRSLFKAPAQMTFIVWFALLGAVLLLLALSSSYLRWIPVTSSVVCLGLGIALGTSGLGFLQLDVSKSGGWMEHLTEVAVLF